MKKKSCNFMAALNAVSLVTVLLYALTGKANIFFNLCSVIWFLTILLNVVMPQIVFKKLFSRIIPILFSTILFFMKNEAAFITTNGSFGNILVGLFAVYYLIEIILSLYLAQDKFPEAEKNPPKPAVTLIAAAALLLFSFLTVRLNYGSIISIPLSMSGLGILSVLFMLPSFAFLSFSFAVVVIRRLTAHGAIYPAVLLGIATLFVFIPSYIYEFAFPNTVRLANNSYQQVFGEDGKIFFADLAETVIGGAESGYTITKDVPYYQFQYEGTDYELQYDMYKQKNEVSATPVIIKLHGSGASKGIRNLALQSEAFAAEGYTVFDINYGNEKTKPSNDELTENICNFLSYLYENRDTLNIDTNNIIITGTSRGGKMTMKTCVAWSANAYGLKDKVTIKGAVIDWGFMSDVLLREGDERIVSLEELNSELPPMLFIDTTNDGSVQGGWMMQGILETLGVKSANVELRYASHGPNTNYYSLYGQFVDFYTLRFSDMVVGK